MPLSFKQVAVSLILASFLASVFFSFAFMTQGPDGRMQGDCPFSAMGASLCPQDTVAAVLHHISAYHSFLNVPINSGTTAAIIFLLLAAYAVLMLSLRPALFRPPMPMNGFSNFPPFTSHNRKIIRWLSLFENSPSRL